MKSWFRFVLTLCVLGLATVRAADDKLTAALRAADDERVAATKAADRARLDAIFSNDLHYGHSSALNETKAQYMASLVSKTTVYDSYEHVTREFKQVAPGLVLMTGRAKIKSHSSTAPTPVDLDLSYLAVWREEGGKWKFLAWQSTRVPAPAPAAAKK